MTSLAPKLLHPEQVSAQKPDGEPWLRQKQEPARWYLRFRRYLDMGPKRSLRAAVVSEPQDEKAQRGNKKQIKNSEQKISDVSVPGAWSRSAKIWRWKERAEAFDMAQLEKQAGLIRESVSLNPFASKAYRLIYLISMASALDEFGKKGLSLEECTAYAKLMQSLFKDISREMEGMDEHTLMIADASARKFLIEQAKS